MSGETIRCSQELATMTQEFSQNGKIADSRVAGVLEATQRQ